MRKAFRRGLGMTLGILLGILLAVVFAGLEVVAVWLLLHGDFNLGLGLGIGGVIGAIMVLKELLGMRP
jgi:hypothetical protein